MAYCEGKLLEKGEEKSLLEFKKKKRPKVENGTENWVALSQWRISS